MWKGSKITVFLKTFSSTTGKEDDMWVDLEEDKVRPEQFTILSVKCMN